MFQSFKRFWLATALIATCSQQVFAYVEQGPPNEAFQVDTIGYNLQTTAELGFGNQNGGGDIGAPKPIGQGYRWNQPVVYYAFDASFASFFGPLGMAEVDKAFAVFNNLTNVSSFSPGLTEFPLRASHINATAQALGLVDIKSTVMHLIIEQLGLAQPERYVWCLHDRFLPAGSQCPAFEYSIIQRNFDPITKNYSSYVNGALYGYSIVDLCPYNPPPFGGLLADAIEFDTDPRTQFNFALASGYDLFFFLGTYYTGLTRDDIGGLRALYSATNVFTESTGPNVNQAVPTTTPQLLVTQDYATFLNQSSVNNAAALAGLYPGLIVTSETSYFTNAITTNYIAVVSQNPYAPAGNFVATLTPTYTTNIQQRFAHTFANVVILPGHLYTNAFVSFQATSVTQNPYAPVGTLTTNLPTSTSLVTGVTNGDFYILPTTQCGDYFNIKTQLVTVTSNVTALPINLNGITTSVPIVANFITYSTNYTLVVFAENCVTNTVDLRQGIEKITFIRQDFDSLLGSAWTPVTNYYHQTAITNGAPVVETFRRIITQPDIVFSAADLASGPNAAVGLNSLTRTVPNYNTNQVAANQAGPGTVQPQNIQFVFNNTGPIYEAAATSFITPDSTAARAFLWGSFDGTTNTPIIYPSSISLAALEAQIFFQVSTPSPITYSLSHPFSVTLTASGGTPYAASSGKPPYLWSTNNVPLPAGLTLSPSGVLSGTLSGVTTNTPPIILNVQASDSGLRTTQGNLTLVVGP